MIRISQLWVITLYENRLFFVPMPFTVAFSLWRIFKLSLIYFTVGATVYIAQHSSTMRHLDINNSEAYHSSGLIARNKKRNEIFLLRVNWQGSHVGFVHASGCCLPLQALCEMLFREVLALSIYFKVEPAVDCVTKLIYGCFYLHTSLLI